MPILVEGVDARGEEAYLWREGCAGDLKDCDVYKDHRIGLK